MNNYVGIVRDRRGLVYAIDQIQKIKSEFDDCTNEYNLCKIKNNAEICLLIARAALKRKESRGGHIREDFRNEDPIFKLHSIQQKGESINFEPVRK